VDPIGIAWGLALWWDNDFSFSISEFNKFFISGFVTDSKRSLTFFITFLHASTEIEDRIPMWDHFVQRVDGNSIPWVIIGDFNVMSNYWEKSGGTDITDAKLQEFRNFLSFTPFVDLGFSGNVFTWTNKREKENLVMERIDRAIATPSWIDMYPKASVIHETIKNSDHCPIILRTEPNYRRKGYRFHFEAHWNLNSDCKNLIGEAWRLPCIGSEKFKCSRKLNLCKEKLIQWKRNNKENMKMLIIVKNRELAGVQARNINGELGQMEHNLIQEIDAL
jgi:hypothetical protein